MIKMFGQKILSENKLNFFLKCVGGKWEFFLHRNKDIIHEVHGVRGEKSEKWWGENVFCSS